MMNILLSAEESAGIHTLRLIADSNHTIKSVLCDTSKNGTSVATIAKKHGFNILPANLVNDPTFASWMIDNNIDVLLNVHSLFIICPEVVEAAKFGAYNLHPGPLPQYAGLNAPSWAIYNQEKEHGVTLHQIATSIDSGDIIDEARFPISNTETGLSLSVLCVKHGLQLIDTFLDRLQSNPASVIRTTQNLSLRTYYSGNKIPHNGRIMWDNNAEKIDAFVRACNYSPFQSPWGAPTTSNGNIDISILKTEISDLFCNKTPGTIGEPINKKTAIATRDYWILVNRCLMDGIHVNADAILKPGDLLS